eukprot:s234_g38.t1
MREAASSNSTSKFARCSSFKVGQVVMTCRTESANEHTLNQMQEKWKHKNTIWQWNDLIFLGGSYLNSSTVFWHSKKGSKYATGIPW